MGRSFNLPWIVLASLAVSCGPPAPATTSAEPVRGELATPVTAGEEAPALDVAADAATAPDAIEDLDASATTELRAIGAPWHPRAVLHVSADGTRVAARRPAHVEIYDAVSGERVADVAMIGGRARDHRLGGDGRFLAVVTDEPAILVWDLSQPSPSPTRIPVPGLDAEARLVAAADRVFAVLTRTDDGSGAVHFANAETHGIESRVDGVNHASQAALSRDGLLFAYDHGITPTVLDRTDGTSDEYVGSGGMAYGTPVALSASGRFLALANDGGELFVIDRSTSVVAASYGTRSGAWAFAGESGSLYGVVLADLVRITPGAEPELLPCRGAFDTIGIRSDGTVELGGCAVRADGSLGDRWLRVEGPYFGFAGEDTVEAFRPTTPWDLDAPDDPTTPDRRTIHSCSVSTGRCTPVSLADHPWPSVVLLEHHRLDLAGDGRTLRALARVPSGASSLQPLGDGRVSGRAGETWFIVGPTGPLIRPDTPVPTDTCALGRDVVGRVGGDWWRIRPSGVGETIPVELHGPRDAAGCDSDREVLVVAGGDMDDEGRWQVAVRVDARDASGALLASARIEGSAPPERVTISSAGGRVAVLTRAWVAILQAADLSVEAILDLEPYLPDDGGALTAVWSPSGRRLLLVGPSSDVWIWEAPSAP